MKKHTSARVAMPTTNGALECIGAEVAKVIIAEASSRFQARLNHLTRNVQWNGPAKFAGDYIDCCVEAVADLAGLITHSIMASRKRHRPVHYSDIVSAAVLLIVDFTKTASAEAWLGAAFENAVNERLPRIDLEEYRSNIALPTPGDPEIDCFPTEDQIAMRVSVSAYSHPLTSLFSVEDQIVLHMPLGELLRTDCIPGDIREAFSRHLGRLRSGWAKRTSVAAMHQIKLCIYTTPSAPREKIGLGSKLSDKQREDLLKKGTLTQVETAKLFNRSDRYIRKLVAAKNIFKMSGKRIVKDEKFLRVYNELRIVI